MELKKKKIMQVFALLKYNLIAFLFDTNRAKFSGLIALKFDYGVKQN